MSYLFAQWLVRYAFEALSTLIIAFGIRLFLTPYDCKDLNCLYYCRYNQRFRTTPTEEMKAFLVASVVWIPVFGIAVLTQSLSVYHLWIIVPGVVQYIIVWVIIVKREWNYVRLRSTSYISTKYGTTEDLYAILVRYDILCFPIDDMEDSLQLDAGQKKATLITDTEIRKKVSEFIKELINTYNTRVKLHKLVSTLLMKDQIRQNSDNKRIYAM